MRVISAVLAGLVLLSGAVPASAFSDAQIKAKIIAESREAYPGPCGCPEDRDRAGRRCGKRSAHDRPGGYEVICYPREVTDEQIRSWNVFRRANLTP